MLKAFFLLLCSSMSFAFITHQDFSELPTHQKKAYLQLIQNLSVQAEESFQTSASFNYKLPSWLAFVNSVEAFANETSPQLAADGICRISSASSMTDSEILSRILDTLSCSEIPMNGAVSRFSPVVIERIEVLETELNRRPKNKTIRTALRELEEVKQDVRKRGIIGGRTLSEGTSTTLSLPKEAPRAQPAVVLPPQSTAAPAVTAPKPAPPSPVTPINPTTPVAAAAPALPAQAVIEKKTELKLDQVLCLYAGHIVTKAVSNKCQAQNQLADPELNAFFNFKCLPNEALCHPLAFGFISGCASDSKNDCTDRKPICVGKSKSASATCLEKSRKYKGLDHLVLILDKPEMAASFDLYQRELKMICEPQWIQSARLSNRGRTDLSETCEKTFEAIQNILNIQKTKLDLKTRPGQK